MNKFLGLLLLVSNIAFAGTTVFQTDNLQFGKPTNADKDLIFKRATFATSPQIKWNESTSSLQFSNDGTLFSDIASSNTVDIPLAEVNIGLTASVSANALSVALKGKNGNDPSNTNVVSVAFRNATATTGRYAALNIVAAMSITAPSGASLGSVGGGRAQYVWVYLLNDAGTPDLCLSSGTVFFDETLNSSTQISAGSTSAAILYCAASHSGAKPTRLIGRLLSAQTTAGVWSSATTETSLMPIPKYNASVDWIDGSTITITATSVDPTKGTTSTDKVRYKRDGKDIIANYAYVQSGTGAAGTGDYLYRLPASFVADTTFITAYSTVLGNGTQWKPSNVIGHGTGSGSSEFGHYECSLYDGPHFRCFHMGTASQSVDTAASNGNLSLSNITKNFEVRVPILGWSAYGP